MQLNSMAVCSHVEFQTTKVFTRTQTLHTNSCNKNLFTQGANLSDALMDRAVLNEANLTNAVLERVVLTRSDLTGAVVQGADFSNALVDRDQQMVYDACCSTCD